MIGDLLDCERRLTDALERTRARLDGELIAAQQNRAPSKELAHLLRERDGGPATAAELERVARALRMRTTIANRRAAKGVGKCGVAAAVVAPQDGTQERESAVERSYLLKRRIVEETYSLPGEAPDVEDLNDEQLASDDEDDDDLEPVDHALGDATDDDEFDDE